MFSSFPKRRPKKGCMWKKSWVRISPKCPSKVITGFMCLENSVEPKTSVPRELFLREGGHSVGMMVWRYLDFSKSGWRDPQKKFTGIAKSTGKIAGMTRSTEKIAGMTVFVLLDVGGICTALLPIFRDHWKYFGILRGHLSNWNRKMIA